MKAYVYALVDPRDNAIRYIGKARSLKSRRFGHMVKARNGCHSHRCYWIRSLLALSIEPEIICLEECRDDAHAMKREIFWIAHHKSIGAKLCNHTEGGDGILGFKHSEDSKARILAAVLARGKGYKHKGKFEFEKPKAKRGQKKGFTLSAEARAKISATLKGRKLPLEVRLKISASQKGRPSIPCSLEKKKSMSATKMLRRNKATLAFVGLLYLIPGEELCVLIAAYLWRYYWRYRKDEVRSTKNSKRKLFLPVLRQ